MERRPSSVDACFLPRGAVLRSGGFEDTVWATTAGGPEECWERTRIGREQPF
jgi:hypothetical protein